MGLDNGLAPYRRQAIIWTNADPIHWRIYAPLGGDELTGKLYNYQINIMSFIVTSDVVYHLGYRG